MQSNHEQITVVIVDDHPLVIEGFKNVVNSDRRLSLKGAFTSAADFMEFAREHAVDMVLMDITLPDGSGVQLCRELKQVQPATMVLAISNLSERSIIRQMLQSGANGYLLKTADAKDILQCIGQAWNGTIALSKEVAAIFDLNELKESVPIPELTKREKQILRLLAEGKKSAQIAAELFISPLTVKTHRATLLQKLETHNIVLAINKAREYGIIR